MPKPPQGTHPIATFIGGDRYTSDDELALLDNEGPTVLGEGMIRCLGPRLAKHGLAIGEPDGSSSGGWEVGLRVDGARFWLSVACLGEPSERWLLTVDEHQSFLGGLLSRSHANEFKKVLGLVHDVLRAVEGVNDINWYDPDDWIGGREDQWHPTPVSGGSGTEGSK